MSMKELIEQIGGRERLEFIAGNAISRERSMMARALLAVLDAKPIAYMHHSGQVVTREECCDDKVFSICCKVETPLYTTPPAASVNYPVIPEGWILMPRKLTAENGAKAALSGDFAEHKFINCPECFGDDECESCDGSGRIKVEVTVSWSTIKAIWEKGADHFAAAPAPGGDGG